MSKIENDLLLKLEKLARLELSEGERNQISQDLERILDMFDELQRVDTEGVTPLRHISPIVNRVREDVIQGELTVEQALINVKSHVGTAIAVPKFLKPK